MLSGAFKLDSINLIQFSILSRRVGRSHLTFMDVHQLPLLNQVLGHCKLSINSTMVKV